MTDTPARIDPAGCGCTDCIIGYSKPLDEATEEQVYQMRLGLIDDATGVDRQ